MQIGEQYNQSCKLQLSNKSQTEHRDVVPTTYIQSNNVWEKNKFKIGKGRSKSSKHQLLLSLQRHHIIVSYNEEQPSKQHQWCQPNLPCQHASKSTTDFGITKETANNPSIIDHNSIAIGQQSNRWSTFSPLHLQIKHQSKSKYAFCVNSQLSKFSPMPQSTQRMQL